MGIDTPNPAGEQSKTPKTRALHLQNPDTRRKPTEQIEETQEQGAKTLEGIPRVEPGEAPSAESPEAKKRRGDIKAIEAYLKGDKEIVQFFAKVIAEVGPEKFNIMLETAKSKMLPPSKIYDDFKEAMDKAEEDKAREVVNVATPDQPPSEDETSTQVIPTQPPKKKRWWQFGKKK